MRTIKALTLGSFCAEQFLKLVHEGVDILELAVNGCEADICYLVYTLENVHCVFADKGGRYLAVKRILKLGFDLSHRMFDSFERNRTLFTCTQETVEQLLAVKCLAGFILFYDDKRDSLDYFICCETLSAAQTLTAAADPLAFVGGSGIDDLALRIIAEWASHNKQLLFFGRYNMLYQV